MAIYTAIEYCEAIILLIGLSLILTRLLINIIHIINIVHSLSAQIHATRSGDEYLIKRTNTVF